MHRQPTRSKWRRFWSSHTRFARHLSSLPQTAHWRVLAVYGNSHTGPHEAVCFPDPFAFPKTVKDVVPSKKRMKSKTSLRNPSRKRSNSCARPSIGIQPCKVNVSQSIGFTATRNEACGLGIRFQEFMQTAEECVAEAHGQTEQERGRLFGRAAGVRFRLRTVVSARRHLATRQCHNKHAN